MRDVLVIGGGIVGALVALELVRANAHSQSHPHSHSHSHSHLSVELLDKDAIAGGASSHAGAIDSPYSWTARHAELQAESWRWHDSVGRCLPSAEHRRPIELHWLGREHDQEQLREVVRASTRPGAVPRGYPASHCVCSEAYVVDPVGLIDATLAQAAGAGLEITRGVRVSAIQAEGTRVRVEGEDGSERRARHVVLALGPWVASLSGGAFGPPPSARLRVKRVHGLRLEAATAMPRTRAWADPSRGLFLFPRLVDSTWAMSINHPVWDVDPDAPQPPHRPLLKRAEPLLDAVLGADQWELSEWRTFADTYTPSRAPLVEHVAGGLGTVVSGTHGSGVRLAPALAQSAAKLARASLRSRRSRLSRDRDVCLD